VVNFTCDGDTSVVWSAGLAKHYETQDGLMTECGTLG
jgi:hypothetical protein